MTRPSERLILSLATFEQFAVQFSCEQEWVAFVLASTITSISPSVYPNALIACSSNPLRSLIGIASVSDLDVGPSVDTWTLCLFIDGICDFI